MKKLHFIPAFILSSFLLTGLTGCDQQMQYYNPNQTSSAAEVTTEEASTTEASTEATTEETTEETTEATTEETTPETTAGRQPAIGDIWYVNTEQLNIRDIPSTDGNKIGELYRNEEVRILELAGDGWVLMHSASMDGYVKSDFLVSSPDKVEGAISSAAVVTSSAAVVTSSAAVVTSSAAPSSPNASHGHIVCIDAGHQQAGISELEPNAPGSSVMKAKLTTGTSGVVTGLVEYQLNLDVSQMLQAELINRGYQVVMVRNSNDCPMSNAERAVFANESGAEIFVRIHANSSDNPEVNGAMFYAPSAANAYLSADVISASNTLSSTMLSFYCSTTGLANKGVLQDDSMTGINWCKIPVTIVEMGFMSNPDEDRKMADPSFQALIAQGLANGIDAYFGR